MKNDLGRNVNAGLKPLAQFVEALRAVRWRDESNLFDFHELRQGFIPPIGKMKNGLGRKVNGPTRPSGTLPREASAIKITQNIQII